MSWLFPGMEESAMRMNTLSLKLNYPDDTSDISRGDKSDKNRDKKSITKQIRAKKHKDTVDAISAKFPNLK
jgi:hypothetical protein